MRVPGFKGFLSSYVRELSGKNTLRISRLAADASAANPRLREPLFLYALINDKVETLLRAVKDNELHDEYCEMASKFDKTSIIDALSIDKSDVSHEYKKVYRSYCYTANRFQNERHTKSLMRNKIVSMQRERNVSTYRLHKDLGINSGNLNAFLNSGNVDKVSLRAAGRVLEYLSGRRYP